MPGRQFHGCLSHPLALRSGLVRQKPAQRLGDQITQRGAAFYGRDLGALDKLIGKIERRTHKYAYMLSCIANSPVQPAASQGASSPYVLVFIALKLQVVHTAGATGSIPVPPTILNKNLGRVPKPDWPTFPAHRRQGCRELVCLSG